MPFLGNLPNASFQSRPTRQEFSGDGSTTVFTLNQTARAEDIIVSVDGVVQEPDGSYTVPNGTALTFDEAPSSNAGNNIFVMYMGTSAGSISPAAENRGNFKAGGIFRTAIAERERQQKAQQVIVGDSVDAAIKKAGG